MVPEPESYHLFSICTRNVQAIGFRVLDTKYLLLQVNDDLDCLAESRSHLFDRILLLPRLRSTTVRQACDV